MFKDVVGNKIDGLLNGLNYSNVIYNLSNNLSPRVFSINAGGISYSFRGIENYYREQWWSGLKKNGFIGKYSPVTVKIKMKKMLPYDRVTLFDTGENYKTLSITLKQKDLVVIPGVDYFDELIKKYGNDILFLHDDYLSLLRKDIKMSILGLIQSNIKKYM